MYSAWLLILTLIARSVLAESATEAPAATAPAETACSALAPQAMTEAMLLRDKAWLASQPVSFIILPFSHNIAIPDRELMWSFPVLLRNTLQSSGHIAAASPALLHDALKKQPVIAENYFDESLGLAVARAVGAHYAVIGKVNSYLDNLTAYVRVIDATQAQGHASPVFEFQGEKSGRFFDMAEQIHHKILETTGVKNPFSLSMEKLFNSFESFRYLVKGALHQVGYDQPALELAKTWFMRNTATHYDSFYGYLELARTEFQRAIFAQAQGKDGTLFFHEGERAYDRALVINRRLGLNLGTLGVERFLSGAAALRTALAFSQQSACQNNRSHVSEAIGLIPESPLALKAALQCPPTGAANSSDNTTEGGFQIKLSAAQAEHLFNQIHPCL